MVGFFWDLRSCWSNGGNLLDLGLEMRKYADVGNHHQLDEDEFHALLTHL